MVRRTQAAALAALAALALGAMSGCGGGTPVARPVTTPPDGSGYFVGHGDGGLGAAVDLEAHDPVIGRATAAILDAPGRDGRPAVAVGLASVVNDSARPQPLPRFIAVVEGGGATPLVPARSAAADIPGARGIFPSPPLFIPAGGSATVHLVLRGARPEEVERVKMVVRAGESVTLRAHRR